VNVDPLSWGIRLVLGLSLETVAQPRATVEALSTTMVPGIAMRRRVFRCLKKVQFYRSCAIFAPAIFLENIDLHVSS
jgi:hypothetical protein